MFGFREQGRIFVYFNHYVIDRYGVDTLFYICIKQITQIQKLVFLF